MVRPWRAHASPDRRPRDRPQQKPKLRVSRSRRHANQVFTRRDQPRAERWPTAQARGDLPRSQVSGVMPLSPPAHRYMSHDDREDTHMPLVPAHGIVQGLVSCHYSTYSTHTSKRWAGVCAGFHSKTVVSTHRRHRAHASNGRAVHPQRDTYKVCGHKTTRQRL